MLVTAVVATLIASAGRVRIDLNQGWQFRRGDTGETWQPATLPHTPWIRPLGASEIWHGVTTYRRRLDLTAAQRRRRVVLTIEAAMQSSEMWLNGEKVAVRAGGYLPLVADLTGKLKDRNEIVVTVDNSDNPLIPPGKPQKDLDFMYGCGLYRNAYLTVTGPVFITDPILEDKPRSGGIYITYPLVTSARSIVRVRTHIRNSTPTSTVAKVEQVLKDREGSVVARASSVQALAASSDEQISEDLEIKNPSLWSPDSPYLYTLETVLRPVGDGKRWLGPPGQVCLRLPAEGPDQDLEGPETLGLEGRATLATAQTSVHEEGELDRVVTRVGIRSVEVSRSKGFLLNGKPIRLVGTNRHQDYPWIGVALSDACQYRDAVLIKRAGHNVVRLSHYPQSPAFLDACDELGIMTIPCAAGWQFMNKDPLFRARVDQDIRELIRRDRNHPSAVLWETNLNETYPPNEIAKDWDAAARGESWDGRVLTSGDGRAGSPWDVIYNQWRDEDMSRPQSAEPDKPGYIREYGDYEFGGAHSSSRVRFADGQDALMQQAWNEVWSLNRYRPQYPWTMGAGTWVMFDHNVPWDFRISACGLADLFRIPKPAYWFFASQESKAPILKIEPYKDKIVVFTNCDEVALTVGGKRIVKRRGGASVPTTYDQARPFDGSNMGNLAQPPFIFDVRAGSLHVDAEGLKGGRVVVTDTLRPAGSAAGLKVWVDDVGVPLKADGADVVFVRAAVVDRFGVVVTSATGTVRFTAQGAGSVAGEPEVPLQMGVASELVRGSSQPGAITVRAHLLGGTVSGSMRLRSR